MADVSETQELLRTWAAICGAAGTALAIALALFRDTFWRWWRRPKLVLHAPSGSEEGVSWIRGSPDIDASRLDLWVYLRLEVENQGRGEVASDVRVIVIGAGEGARLPRRELKWAHQDGGTLTIPASSSRTIDVIRRHVFVAAYPSASGSGEISVLCAAVTPGDDNPWPPGGMNSFRDPDLLNRIQPPEEAESERVESYLDVEIVAANHRPTWWRISFCWTEWSPVVNVAGSGFDDPLSVDILQQELLREFGWVAVRQLTNQEP